MEGPPTTQVSVQELNPSTARASFSGPSKGPFSGAKATVPARLLNNKISLRQNTTTYNDGRMREMMREIQNPNLWFLILKDDDRNVEQSTGRLL
ncbi:hypothetical protein NQ318_002012 [Aromia moschata]|uniref:Uncharacterized protein n=1 Tax=Aromia moschata TaxID=1265417 RepID=A0AAV8Z285_9CUCU|nr:hypothetical protein NQ318_002012 [Aromia moschata]